MLGDDDVIFESDGRSRGREGEGTKGGGCEEEKVEREGNLERGRENL